MTNSELAKELRYVKNNLSKSEDLSNVGIIKKHSVARDFIVRLANHFNTSPFVVSLKLARLVDPIPLKKEARMLFQGLYLGVIPYKNKREVLKWGSYIGLGALKTTLILFVFSRPGYEKKGFDICWRAYLIRDSDGKIIYMPPKNNGSFNSYRQGEEGFKYLISDIERMMKATSVV